MKKVKQQFSPRQIMETPDFEVFHYLDSRPIDVEYHNHDFYEIFFFLSGRVSYVIEGKTYHLKPGDILLTSNRELHKPVVEDGRLYERFVTWISPSFTAALQEDDIDLSACFDESSRHHANLLRPSSDLLQTIRGLYDKLEFATDCNSYGAPILRLAYMMELLVCINMAYRDAAAMPEPDMVYNQKISDVIRYINSHLQEELSLDLLASEFFVSKYHLSRQFKQYVGLTLHQYILKKRLIAAKALLVEGESVNSAYLASGFGDYSNFTKLFKLEFGLSPKQFSMQRKNRSAQR